MTDSVTISVRLDEVVYDRLNRKKQAAGLSWQGVLKQADLSHIRTPGLAEQEAGEA